MKGYEQALTEAFSELPSYAKKETAVTQRRTLILASVISFSVGFGVMALLLLIMMS